jgi:predicted double-glycine peptidase
MNVFGVLALVLGVGFFAASHHCFKSKPAGVRVGAFLLSGILSIPSILFAAYYLHVLPEAAWFYELRSWPRSELLAVFLGIAGGITTTFLPRFLLILPLGGTIVTLSVPYLKMALAPLKAEELRERWEGSVCLQSSESTCGPASAATILRFLGEDASEREIARAAFSTSRGTEAWYLARYLRKRGLSAKFDFRPTFTPAVAFPAIVGVRVAGFGHFIVVLGIEDGMVTFVDPLSGQQKVTLSEFMKTHDFTGFHLSVSKRNRG